jgi:hypothetical protein
LNKKDFFLDFRLGKVLKSWLNFLRSIWKLKVLMLRLMRGMVTSLILPNFVWCGC